MVTAQTIAAKFAKQTRTKSAYKVCLVSACPPFSVTVLLVASRQSHVGAVDIDPNVPGANEPYRGRETARSDL